MAVELAAAYVSIIPSFDGVKERFSKEFGGLDSVAKREGDSAGTAFGRSFADKAKDYAMKAGLAASAALGAGFAKSLSVEAGTDKLAAQLGLTAEESGKAGKLAADLYKGAYGDSLGQVNEAIAGVSKNISGLGTTGAADMKRLGAKTLDLATAFDQDLAQSTAAVGDLVKNGLAKNADEAFDIITVGFQKGANKADDFLTTLTEYSTQFKKLGIDGATATGLLTQGLAAGARDSDYIADALKEFAIRAIDGSKLTGEGFQALGLDARKMADDIAAGGPRSAAALDLTLDRLRDIKDPVAQAAAATALFGTKAEDLGSALFALDPSAAVAGLGQVEGAATRMGDTLNDNTNTRLESFKRTIELAGAGVGDFVGPLGAALPALGGLTTTLGGLGPIGGKVKDLAGGLGSAAKSGAEFAATQAAGSANTVRTTAALVAQKAVLVAQSVATKVAAVAQGIFNAVMALNPIFLIVIAVVAFIAVLVLAYKKVEFFRNFVDGAFRLILGVVQAVVGWVKDNWPLLLAIITGPIGLAVLAVVRNFDTIKAAFGAVKDFIRDRIGDVVGFITGIPGRIGSVVSTMWDGIKNAFVAVKDFVRDRIVDYVTFVTSIRDRILGVARGIFDPIKDAFLGVIRALVDAWNRLDFGINISVPDWIPGIGGRGFRVDDVFPDVPSFDGGGTVPGRAGSPQLILAHGGEQVFTPAQAAGAGTTINVTASTRRDEETAREIAMRVRNATWLAAR